MNIFYSFVDEFDPVSFIVAFENTFNAQLFAMVIVVNI